MNLYGFVGNLVTSLFDFLGLDPQSVSEPCIMCHGVSAFGFNGDPQSFSNYLPSSGPNAAVGYHKLATASQVPLAALESAGGMALLSAPEPVATKLVGAALVMDGGDRLQAWFSGETYFEKAAHQLPWMTDEDVQRLVLIKDINLTVLGLAAGLSSQPSSIVNRNKVCNVPGKFSVLDTRCFPAGTLVLTSSGSKRIETLKVDDVVLAYDFETEQFVNSRILRTEQSHTDWWLELDFVDGSSIVSTRGHRYWVESEEEWRQAINLKPGMSVLQRDGSELEIVGWRLIPDKNGMTFNIEVESLHNYLVGPNGVLVHNGGPETILGQILAGVPEDTLISITTGSPSEISGKTFPHLGHNSPGMFSGSSWAQLKDVSHMTVSEYKIRVVGTAAAGHGPHTVGIVTKAFDPNIFSEIDIPNLSNTPEFVNKSPVMPDGYYKLPKK